MCKEMIHESFAKDSVIFVENSQSNCFYIIKKGTVGAYINENRVRTLSEKEHFGLIGIMRKVNRTSTVIALEDCELFSIGIESFEKIFQQNFMDYLVQLYIIYVFKKSKFLSFFPKTRLKEIASSFETQFFKIHEVIFPAGLDVLNNIVVIVEGTIIDVIYA